MAVQLSLDGDRPGARPGKLRDRFGIGRAGGGAGKGTGEAFKVMSVLDDVMPEYGVRQGSVGQRAVERHGANGRGKRRGVAEGGLGKGHGLVSCR